MSIAVALLFTAPAVQAATFAGRNGDIAFVKANHGTANIWVMGPGGGRERQLTYEGASSPVWSPDGRTLAFVHANGRLYNMNADGSNQRPLTGTPGYSESSPVWSPSAQHIVFVRTEQTGQKRSAIFTVSLDGAHERNLSGWSPSGEGYRGPSWAPDSKRIVYEHFGADFGRLFVRNVQSGQMRELTTVTAGTVASASWSPSGNKILFNDSPAEIYTIWPDGSHRTVISDGDSYHATWSPDGTSIAFVEDLGGDSLSISRADGSIVYLPIQKFGYTRLGQVLWSPTGNKLLIVLSDSDSQLSGIFKIAVDGTNQKRLTAGRVGQPNWQARIEQ